MGLIRNALGSALGANDVKNGFNGPQLPFAKAQLRQQGVSEHVASPQLSFPTSTASTGIQGQAIDCVSPHPQGERSPSPKLPPRQADHLSCNASPDQYTHNQFGIKYSSNSSQFGATSLQQDTRQLYSDQANHDSSLSRGRQSRSVAVPSKFFRPIALPQITHGDYQPFLRAYSYDLQEYGISKEVFIQTVDAINKAVVPSPEMKIFQKGANIAGWFLPGAASAGLMAGQIAVGVGGALGHVAMINKVLAKANLDIFVPQGLEICIGKSSDLDNEVGRQSPINQQYQTSTAERLESYGQLIAPLDEVLPEAKSTGRTDPIAALGDGIGKKDDEKKMGKAQKKMTKGKTEKMDAIEQGLKWLLVRRATEKARNEWQRTLQQSKEDLRNAQLQTGRST